MKRFLTTSALAMALSAGSMPASPIPTTAGCRTFGRRGSLSRSGDRAEQRGIYGEERTGRYEKKRIARAAISDDEDFDYRPRRSLRDDKRAFNAAARKSRGERKVRHVAVDRPLPQVRSPKWTQRSVSGVRTLWFRAIGHGLLLLAGPACGLGRLVQPQCYDRSA